MNYVEEENKKREIINKLQMFCDRYLNDFNEFESIASIRFPDELSKVNVYSAFEFRDLSNQKIFTISPSGRFDAKNISLEKDKIYTIYQLSKMISDFFKELKVDD